VVHTNGIDQFAACAAARRQELLDVAQRNSRFGCHLYRTEVRIGIAILYDAADSGEQPVRMTRDGPRIRPRKEGAKQIVEGEPHLRAGRRGCGFFIADAVENELTEDARCERSTTPVYATPGLETELGNKRLARHINGQKLRTAVREARPLRSAAG
jgi:hypothetical protein